MKAEVGEATVIAPINFVAAFGGAFVAFALFVPIVAGATNADFIGSDCFAIPHERHDPFGFINMDEVGL